MENSSDDEFEKLAGQGRFSLLMTCVNAAAIQNNFKVALSFLKDGQNVSLRLFAAVE